MAMNINSDKERLIRLIEQRWGQRSLAQIWHYDVPSELKITLGLRQEEPFKEWILEHAIPKVVRGEESKFGLSKRETFLPKLLDVALCENCPYVTIWHGAEKSCTSGNFGFHFVDFGNCAKLFKHRNDDVLCRKLGKLRIVRTQTSCKSRWIFPQEEERYVQMGEQLLLLRLGHKMQQQQETIFSALQSLPQKPPTEQQRQQPQSTILTPPQALTKPHNHHRYAQCHRIPPLISSTDEKSSPPYEQLPPPDPVKEWKNQHLHHKQQLAEHAKENMEASSSDDEEKERLRNLLFWEYEQATNSISPPQMDHLSSSSIATTATTTNTRPSPLVAVVTPEHPTFMSSEKTRHAPLPLPFPTPPLHDEELWIACGPVKSGDDHDDEICISSDTDMDVVDSLLLELDRASSSMERQESHVAMDDFSMGSIHTFPVPTSTQEEDMEDEGSFAFEPFPDLLTMEERQRGLQRSREGGKIRHNPPSEISCTLGGGFVGRTTSSSVGQADDERGPPGGAFPSFDRNGTIMSQEDRAHMARKRGLCESCGRRTHEVGWFQRKPITNESVSNGFCLICHPENSPEPSPPPRVQLLGSAVPSTRSLESQSEIFEKEAIVKRAQQKTSKKKKKLMNLAVPRTISMDDIGIDRTIPKPHPCEGPRLFSTSPPEMLRSTRYFGAPRLREKSVGLASPYSQPLHAVDGQFHRAQGVTPFAAPTAPHSSTFGPGRGGFPIRESSRRKLLAKESQRSTHATQEFAPMANAMPVASLEAESSEYDDEVKMSQKQARRDSTRKAPHLTKNDDQAEPASARLARLRRSSLAGSPAPTVETRGQHTSDEGFFGRDPRKGGAVSRREEVETFAALARQESTEGSSSEDFEFVVSQQQVRKASTEKRSTGTEYSDQTAGASARLANLPTARSSHRRRSSEHGTKLPMAESLGRRSGDKELFGREIVRTQKRSARGEVDAFMGSMLGVRVTNASSRGRSFATGPALNRSFEVGHSTYAGAALSIAPRRRRMVDADTDGSRKVVTTKHGRRVHRRSRIWNDTSSEAPNGIRDSSHHLVKVVRKLHRLRKLRDNDTVSRGLSAIVKTMKTYPETTKVQIAACGALWTMVASNGSTSDASRATVEKGAITAVLESVRLGEVELMETAFGALSTLSKRPGNKKAIVQAGGIDAIVSGLLKRPDSPTVFEWACRALCGLVYHFDLPSETWDESTDEIWSEILQNIAALQSSEAASSVLKSVANCTNSVVAIEWGLDLLRRLSLENEASLNGDDAAVAGRDKVLEQLLREDGINVVAFIVKIRPTSEGLQEKAYELLCALMDRASLNGTLREVLSSSGTPRIRTTSSCIGAMIEFPNNEALKNMSCRLLSILACTDDGAKIGRVGIEAVLVAAESSSFSDSLQESVTWVLWSGSVQRLLLKDSSQLVSRCCGVLCRVMRKSPGSATLLTAASHAMANFVLHSTHVCDPPFRVMANAMQKYSSDGQLVVAICRAIHSVCSKDATKLSDAYEAGTVDAVIQAMIRSPSDIQIQEHGCAALCALVRNYTYEVFAGTAKCAKSEGFKAVVDAMQRHTLSVSLHLHGLETIRRVGPCFIQAEIATQAVVGVMEAHCDELELQVLGSRVIHDLAVAAKRDGRDFQPERPLKAVLNALNHRFEDAGASGLGRNACGAMFAVLLHPFELDDVDIMQRVFRVLVELIEINGSCWIDAETSEAALRALELVTQQAMVGTIRATSGDIEAVTFIMQWSMDDIHSGYTTDGIEIAIGTLLGLARDSTNLVTLVKCGGLQAVIDATMKMEGVSLPAQENGFSLIAMASASSNSEVRREITLTASALIDVITNAMLRHEDNNYLQKIGCACLRHLSSYPEICDKTSRGEGVSAIASAMRLLESDVQVQTDGCNALGYMVSIASDDVVKEAQIVELVWKTVRDHLDVTMVQEGAFELLQALTMRFENIKKEIAALNGIVDLIFRSMVEHLSSSKLMETTLLLLPVLTAESGHEGKAQANELGAIINGMMANIDSRKVQKSACQCLVHLLSKRLYEPFRLVELGGLDAIVLGMWAHFDSESVLTEACLALSCIMDHVPADELESVFAEATTKAAPAVLTSLRLYPHSAILQESARLALQKLSSLKHLAAVLMQGDVQEVWNLSA